MPPGLSVSNQLYPYGESINLSGFVLSKNELSFFGRMDVNV